MKIEIIFEPRVHHAQFDDGLKFFRYDSFTRVGPQLRRFHPQQNVEGDFFRDDRERITETDIHLQWDDCLANARL